MSTTHSSDAGSREGGGKGGRGKGGGKGHGKGSGKGGGKGSGKGHGKGRGKGHGKGHGKGGRGRPDNSDWRSRETDEPVEKRLATRVEGDPRDDARISQSPAESVSAIKSAQVGAQCEPPGIDRLSVLPKVLLIHIAAWLPPFSSVGLALDDSCSRALGKTSKRLQNACIAPSILSTLDHKIAFLLWHGEIARWVPAAVEIALVEPRGANGVRFACFKPNEDEPTHMWVPLSDLSRVLSVDRNMNIKTPPWDLMTPSCTAKEWDRLCDNTLDSNAPEHYATPRYIGIDAYDPDAAFPAYINGAYLPPSTQTLWRWNPVLEEFTPGMPIVGFEKGTDDGHKLEAIRLEKTYGSSCARCDCACIAKQTADAEEISLELALVNRIRHAHGEEPDDYYLEAVCEYCEADEAGSRFLSANRGYR